MKNTKTKLFKIHIELLSDLGWNTSVQVTGARQEESWTENLAWKPGLETWLGNLAWKQSTGRAGFDEVL